VFPVPGNRFAPLCCEAMGPLRREAVLGTRSRSCYRIGDAVCGRQHLSNLWPSTARGTPSRYHGRSDWRLHRRHVACATRRAADRSLQLPDPRAPGAMDEICRIYNQKVLSDPRRGPDAWTP